jgi:DNA/RNA-binding domain of Phe-tRNA-synthetase-like protein
MTFSLSPSLQSIVHPGALAFDGVTVVDRDPRLDASLLEAEQEWGGGARTAVARSPAGTDAVRAMYRAVGLDPTKRRPSSEALLRRVLRGDPLPRVNALVDICNWCSLEFQLPYGVYDLARVDGAIELRLGKPGEEYAGIRKDVVHVDGRLTLADRQGPFGNPSSDSARTMVTTATTAALVVVYAPRQLPTETLKAALDATASRILDFVGGRETSRFVV